MTRGHLTAFIAVTCAACTERGSTPPETPPLVEPSAACRQHASVEYVVELTGAFGDRDGVALHATTNIELAEPGGAGTLCQTTRAVTVDNGAVAVTLTNLTDAAVYPFIGAYLDVDGDGLCSPLDPTWGIYGVIARLGEPDRITLDPAMFLLDDPREVCSHFATAGG